MPSVEQLVLPLEMNPSVATATAPRRARIADSAPEGDSAGVATITRQPRSIRKRKGRIKIQELTCTDCHHFVRVNGRPGCTDTHQKEGKPCYKLLKSLKPCERLWPVNRRGAQHKRGYVALERG